MNALVPLGDIAQALRPDLKGLDGATPPAPLGAAVTLQSVPVAALRIDPAYQRKVGARGRGAIRCILRGFSWARFSALACARIDGGGFAVIDGQHRAVAAALLGIAEVPAIVSAEPPAGQAADFIGINTVRSALVAVDKFRARVATGEPAAVEIAAMLADLGIDCNVAAGIPLAPRQTRSISTIEKLCKRLGHGTVATALETLLDAQPDQPGLLSAFAIECATALTDLVIDAGASLDRLDRVLAETDFETLKESAGAMMKHLGGRASQHGTEMLRRDFNKGLRAGKAI